MPPFSFVDRHVLLTGASGGLGVGLAFELAQRGAVLGLTSRSPKALNGLIDQLPDYARTYILPCDLSRPGSAEELSRQALDTMGYVDVLINNAGIGYFALIHEAKEENIRYLFELNTFSPLLLARHLAVQMREKRLRGRIINIVSCAGHLPIPAVGVYGGSKSALAVMSRTMGFELEPFDIDVVNIYPGTIDTAFEENALREENRTGLCPRDHCGLPRTDIARKVIQAAQGPAGDRYLESPCRWYSFVGLIRPQTVKRRLAKIRDKVVATKTLKDRRWRLFQVETALSCNLRCIMCPWKEVSCNLPQNGIMPVKVWEAIKPHLDQVRSIDFSGGGEPLLQPGLVQWIKEAKTQGCEAGFLTNGTLLTPDKAREVLAAGVDWVCISMDGADAPVYEKIRVGADFELVRSHISELLKLRSGKKPKVMINFVLMRINYHQVEDMIRMAADLGVDQLNFKQCDVVRGKHGKGLGLFDKEKTKEVAALEKSLARARRLGRKMGLATTAFAFTPEEQPVCEQNPSRSLFVRYNGTVAPCINLAIGGPTTFLGRDVQMPDVHYGRLPEHDLLELWETKSCRFYRERFEQRIQKYESTLVQGFVSGNKGRDRALTAARDAMSAAPEGCRVCHYLYDV